MTYDNWRCDRCKMWHDGYCLEHDKPTKPDGKCKSFPVYERDSDDTSRLIMCDLDDGHTYYCKDCQKFVFDWGSEETGKCTQHNRNVKANQFCSEFVKVR